MLLIMAFTHAFLLLFVGYCLECLEALQSHVSIVAFCSASNGGQIYSALSVSLLCYVIVVCKNEGQIFIRYTKLYIFWASHIHVHSYLLLISAMVKCGQFNSVCPSFCWPKLIKTKRKDFAEDIFVNKFELWNFIHVNYYNQAYYSCYSYIP